MSTPTPTPAPLSFVLSDLLTPINPSGQLTTITDLSTLPGLLLNTTFFIFTWSFLHRYIRNNGPVAIIRDTILPLHNKLYSLFSLLFLLSLLQSLAQNHTNPSNGAPSTSTTLPAFFHTNFLPTVDVQRLRYLYHYTKYYEQFVDTLLLVACGRPIGAHMAFHHLTMPVYTIFRTLRCHGGNSLEQSAGPGGAVPLSGGGDDWVYFTVCNLAHHTLMYAHFGGVGSGVLRGVLHYTQMLQLGVGVGVDGRWFWEHRDMLGSEGKTGGGLMGDREQLGRAVSMLLLTRFAQLYWREYTAEVEGEGRNKGNGSAERAGAVQALGKDRTL